MDENKDEAKTHLQQMSTSFSGKKKETSSKLNASTIEKKAIISTSIFKRKNKSQKTCIGFTKFHASDYT